jgi:hypothetical protein
MCSHPRMVQKVGHSQVGSIYRQRRPPARGPHQRDVEPRGRFSCRKAMWALESLHLDDQTPATRYLI